MQKKNFLGKNWLKLTNKAAYRSYKAIIANNKKNELRKAQFTKLTFDNIEKIKEKIAKDGMINAIHSGNSGDIIYALPTLKKLHEQTGATINLYLRLNKQVVLPAFFVHPLGDVMLNKKMAEMLFPLLRSQPYLASCEIYEEQPINLDMDAFRVEFFPSEYGNIARWPSYITGINPELWKNWLFVEPDTSFANTIIIARSERYRNILIDHCFLSQYDNMVFVGVKSEYEDLKKKVPDLKWVPVDDFLQMARMIAGCKFFIGNQSFPFSIAEALKIPRILEVSLDVINVIPEGGNGYDFLFQPHFESLVAELNAQ
jgi:hypothetical protein